MIMIMIVKKRINKDNSKSIIEYFNSLKEHRRLITKEQNKYKQLYNNIKQKYIKNLNEFQMEVLDKIMYNFIDIQVIAKFPYPQPTEEELKYLDSKPILYQPHYLESYFQTIRTKNNEIFTDYLRSNRFYEFMQNNEIYYKPLDVFINYVINKIQ